ncbi:MAG: metallophosphoesterase, partial [Clostridiales bacterium]|nr:metallophosphoesterase [Clostridiales bacterium]
KTEKLGEPLRIVLLADLHSCLYGKNQEILLAKINAQNPDLILMCGDIADDDMPHGGTLLLLAGIANKYPCFYVTGNHEIWSGEIDAIKDFFRDYGVCVLEGECQIVEVRGQLINICGVGDPSAGANNFAKQLENAFAGIDEELYTILLSHRPERFEQESAYPCDLILSGHAHGGQWRLPFTSISLIAPNQGLFPKYTSGIYTSNGTKMLVSRGLSRESTRAPRIFNRPEIVVIDLIPE